MKYNSEHIAFLKHLYFSDKSWAKITREFNKKFKLKVHDSLLRSALKRSGVQLRTMSEAGACFWRRLGHVKKVRPRAKTHDDYFRDGIQWAIEQLQAGDKIPDENNLHQTVNYKALAKVFAGYLEDRAKELKE